MNQNPEKTEKTITIIVYDEKQQETTTPKIVEITTTKNVVKQQQQTTIENHKKREIVVQETNEFNENSTEKTHSMENFKPYKFDGNYMLPKNHLPLKREKSKIIKTKQNF